MDLSEKFNQELVELIRKRYPQALSGNIEQNEAVANALAVAMGGIMALAFRLNGEVIGRTVLQTMVKRIIENASTIDANAGAIIRQSIPTILH